MNWVLAVLPTLVALVIVLLPGAALLSLVRLRGLALLAAAPLASVAMVAAAALALGTLRIRWTPLSLVIVVVLMLAVAYAGRAICTRSVPIATTRLRASRMLVIALVIGGLLSLWRLGGYIADPEAISQTNDAIFHLNAVRFVLEEGSASSLQVSGFIGGTGFYPAAWHGIVSQIVMITGADIPIAANALTFAIGAVVWPVGIAWLAQRIFASTTVASVAAILSSALQAFPLLMFQWGVLYPNALSTALIPAAVAIVLSLPGWMSGENGWRGGARAWILGGILVGIAVAAMATSQPAALLAWGLIVAVWLSAFLLGNKRVGNVLALALSAGAWALLAIVWFMFARSTSGSHWAPFRDKYLVFTDILFNGPVLIPFAFGVSVFMLIGLGVIFASRSLRWVGIAWLGVSALYVLVAAVGIGFVRDVVFGPWYADPYRIAALMPILVIPVAAFGLVRVVTFVLARTRVSIERVGLIAASAAVVLMVGVILVRPVPMPIVAIQKFELATQYLQDDSSYLSTDERALLEKLPQLVPADATVIGNPGTGTGFGYMLSGRDVFPKTWQPPQTDLWRTIQSNLRDAADDPAVCEALDAYGSPEYVLDFGPGEAGGGKYLAPGMTEFDGMPGFEEVDRVGDASLWRITACTA